MQNAQIFAKETGAAVFCTKKMIIINVWLVCAFACVAVPVGGWWWRRRRRRSKSRDRESELKKMTKALSSLNLNLVIIIIILLLLFPLVRLQETMAESASAAAVEEEVKDHRGWPLAPYVAKTKVQRVCK